MSACPPSPTHPNGFSAASLSPAEGFVVTVLRLWAAPYKQPDVQHPDWREGFAAAGADEAQQPFDTLFRIVVASSTRALDVRCLRCPNIGEDEVAFLTMVRMLQRHRWAEVETLLADWLPDETTRPALAQATLFATAIAAAGLILPQHASGGGERGRVTPFPRAYARNRPACIERREGRAP